MSRFTDYATKHEQLMRKLSEAERKMIEQLRHQQEEFDELLAESGVLWVHSRSVYRKCTNCLNWLQTDACLEWPQFLRRFEIVTQNDIHLFTKLKEIGLIYDLPIDWASLDFEWNFNQL